jgi:hypothetical protein
MRGLVIINSIHGFFNDKAYLVDGICRLQLRKESHFCLLYLICENSDMFGIEVFFLMMNNNFYQNFHLIKTEFFVPWY